MGQTASTKTFTLRKDDSLDIPIAFDENFIKLLDRDGGKALKSSRSHGEPSTPSATVSASSTPEKELQKRLIWESRSVAQANAELDEVGATLKKLQNQDTVTLSAEAIDIEDRLLACYKEAPDRILDCPALSQFLDLEKDLLKQYISA